MPALEAPPDLVLADIPVYQQPAAAPPDGIEALLLEAQECLRICMAYFHADRTVPYTDFERWTRAANAKPKKEGGPA